MNSVTRGRIVIQALVALFTAVGAVQAQPLVLGASGQWMHKGTITLSGSGFGSKPAAQPVVWDDASGGKIHDKWDGAWPDNNPTYNTMYRVPQRGISLPHNHITKYIAGAHGDADRADAGYAVMVFKTRSISYPSYSYVSWYHRGDDNWVFGGDNNFKTYAFSNGTGPYNMPNLWYLAYQPPYPNSRTDTAAYVLGDDAWGSAFETIGSPDASGHSHWWDTAVNPFAGVWTKIEQEIKWTNQTDGYIKLWENGVLRVDYQGATDKYPGYTRTEGIGGYARNYGQPENWRYFADIYLDYSRARVVLGNAPTLSASTIREVQIPTNWSASSISISANLGRFEVGQTAYLFVVDANGIASGAGFPVPIGGTAPDTAPPTVLSVTPTANVAGPTANVTAVFSEAMQASTINGTAVVLRDSSNLPVGAAVSYNSSTRTVTLDPGVDLSVGAVYRATIRGGASGVRDTASNPLAADFTWTFTILAPPRPPTNLRIVG